jgi:hypothetical protein
MLLEELSRLTSPFIGAKGVGLTKKAPKRRDGSNVWVNSRDLGKDILPCSRIGAGSFPMTKYSVGPTRSRPEGDATRLVFKERGEEAGQAEPAVYSLQLLASLRSRFGSCPIGTMTTDGSVCRTQ